MKLAKIGIIFNPKGGAGKTTAATNLAYGLQQKGYRVIAVDNDPQGSLRDFHVASGGTVLTVKGYDRSTFTKDILDEREHCDVIIVDCGSKIEPTKSSELIKLADFMLLPVQPSCYDIWVIQDVVELIKVRQSVSNGHPKAAFLMSKVINNTILKREALEALKEMNLPVFESYTSRRVAYATSAQDGKSVINGKCKESHEEMNSIVDELIKEFLC